MLTQDYIELDHLLWSSENIFSALVETNPEYIVISDNNEFLNNSYRYSAWIPEFYCGNIYKPREPGFSNFNLVYEEFLSVFNIFGNDLLKTEVLVLNYDCFSPKRRYNYSVQTPIGGSNKIAFGIRLIPEYGELDDSIVVMTSNCYELFYLQCWQFNEYFGGHN